MPESKPPENNDDNANKNLKPLLDSGELRFSEKLDDKISYLEKEVQDERKNTRTVNFLWILFIVIAADILFLVDTRSWSLPVIVGIFELMGLAVLAQKWDIELVAKLIDKFIYGFGFGGRNRNTPSDQ